MAFNRRQWLRGATAFSAAGAVPYHLLGAAEVALQLPAKSSFPNVLATETCLNNARWHPLSVGAQNAVEQYLAYKSRGVWNPGPNDLVDRMQADAKVLFAKLVNAKLPEIAYVPSTTAGETFIASSLGLPASGGNVVTDALHFEGSLYMYGQLGRQGLDVRIVRPTRDWRISLDDLEAVIDKNTKLVAISLVSMTTGFQHDLKAVCEIAHARGAYVYADMVQAAGVVPIDVKASGVDFCACSGYKWLMGDMGIGFLYVKQELLDRVVHRPVYGFRQMSQMQYHLFPGDPPGDAVMDWTAANTAAGHFEIGTFSNPTIAALSYSLAWIQQIGVENIHAHAQKLTQKLMSNLPRLGFEPLTPAEPASHIVTFSVSQPREIAAKLKRANIDVGISDHRMRVSPSVYNDEKDIDKLIEALS